MLTKKDLLDAIEDILLKMKRFFCNCENLHLIAENECGGERFYELKCLNCGRIHIKRL